MSSESCQRARWYLSLALDGELDTLRERELRRHLRNCPNCALVGSDYETITSMLRSSAPMTPERPIELASRRRRNLRVRSSVVAAAALAVVALGGMKSGDGPSGRITSTRATWAQVSNVVAISASDPARVSLLGQRISA
ncbi:MAG: zf-HC2 domain-containing protein [Gaiellaceae bacterium]